MRYSRPVMLFVFAVGLAGFRCEVAFAEDGEGDENPYAVTASVPTLEKDQFLRRALQLYEAALREPHRMLPRTRVGQHAFVFSLSKGGGVASWFLAEHLPQVSDYSAVGYFIGLATGLVAGSLILRHRTAMEDVVMHLKEGKERGYSIEHHEYAELAAQMPDEECQATLRALIKE